MAELLLFVLMTTRLSFQSTINLLLLIFAWRDYVTEQRREQAPFLYETDKEHAFELYNTFPRDYHDNIRSTYLLFNSLGGLTRNPFFNASPHLGQISTKGDFWSDQQYLLGNTVPRVPEV